jgi:hypothetical protein
VFLGLTLASRYRRRSRAIVGAVLVAVVLVIGVSALTPETSQVQMAVRMGDATLVGPNALNRAYYFSKWIEMIPAMPLFGYGRHMSGLLMDAASRPSPHSLYFWSLLTGGFPALVALLWWATALIARSGRAVMQGSEQLRPWMALLIAVLLAGLANEFKIEATRLVSHVNWLMFVVGTTLAASELALRCED